jgi:signal transduction histidine kinase/ligand-binding sensor domain-containing protein
MLRSARHLCVIVLVSAALLCARSALALDPTLDISQYAHTSWKVRDGFVKGVTTSIAQTPDGYLWLGTDNGLYRFDGIRAIPWQPPAGQRLPSTYINSLLVTHDGRLWISTLKGLASWKDGKLMLYPEVAGFAGNLLQRRDGTLWVGMVQPGRICAIKDGNVQCYGDDRFGAGVWGLYEDSRSNLWVTSATGLWHWDPANPEHYPFPDVEVNRAVESENGALLLATVRGLKRFADGKVQDYVLPGITGRFRPTVFFHASDGSLWIGTLQGLLRLHGGKTDVFGVAQGLSGPSVGNILEDSEGNVWTVTTDGLDRFREYAIPSVSTNEGLSTSQAQTVQATADGALWIGTTNGLNRWQDGRVTVYGGQSPPSPTGQAPAAKSDRRLPGNPQGLGVDNQGRLLAGTREGIFYFENERLVPIPGAPGGNIWSIAGDGGGKLWAVHGTSGLFYFKPNERAELFPWSRFGRKEKGFGAKAMLSDRSRRGVWLGFLDGGIVYFEDGEVRASYTAANGLGRGSVNDLRFGPHGELRVSTEGGLSVVKDGRITTLTTKNGLPCDTVHWTMEDDDHSMWLYTSCGLMRIPQSQFDAWTSDPGQQVQPAVFDTFDGVRILAVRNGLAPPVARAADGKIWFATYDGVSVIDPRHLPFNKVPPPVHIEQITADGTTYDASAGLRLPSRVRNLAIDYTALSLAVPEKVHFRFKLEGQDTDWRDVVNDRQVQYSNLAPKHYRFMVKACNNSGIWNDEGAALDFSIAPAYYQTSWFQALCVAAFLAIFWLSYRYRVHQMQRELNAGLEGRVNERLRIARELHDTLLQSFQGLLLRFQAVSNQLKEGEPKQELQETIDRAAQAITEGRDAVQGLRSSAMETNDLAAALESFGKELARSESQPPEFTVQVEGVPRHLHPVLRDEVYRVAGEALRNAFRHAGAQHIELEIRYDQRQFRLRVRDDGKGIDPKLLGEQGRAGHFGLGGMRERAIRIGGKLAVWSSDPQANRNLDSGTEVELKIPGARAYAKYGEPRYRRWFSETLPGEDPETKS